MKFRWDNRYLHWGVTAFLVIAASMLFYYGIFHMKTLIVGKYAIIKQHTGGNYQKSGYTPV